MRLSALSSVVKLRDFLSVSNNRSSRRFVDRSDSGSKIALQRSRILGLSPTQQFIIRRDMPRPEKRY